MAKWAETTGESVIETKYINSFCEYLVKNSITYGFHYPEKLNK